MAIHDAHPPDRSFLARYGATILRGGIAAIPAALYRYQRELGLSLHQVWFISSILSHKWDADLPHPSLKRMAEDTGVPRQKLHIYQKELVAAGWLSVIDRQNELGGKDTNLFDFSALFGRLEELLDRDKNLDSRQFRAAEGEGSAPNPPTSSSGVTSPYVIPVGHTHVTPVGHGYVTPVGHQFEES